MANYVRIKVRRDNTYNWEVAVNPVLELGEIGYDLDKHILKVGNGMSKWTELPAAGYDLVNDLITGGTDAALTAEQGKALKTLVDQKVDNATLTQELNNMKNNILQQVTELNSGITVEDCDWSSQSTVNALSANSGRVLKGLIDTKASQEDLTNQIAIISGKVDSLSPFGMGYTIDSWNSWQKPTKITFEDGVTCTLLWNGGTQLHSITSSTGEVMKMNYDGDGKIIGRTVTH